MMESRAIKDPAAEARLYSARVFVALAFIVALLLVILARYSWLQLAMYEKFRTQSDANRVHVQSIPPKRGLITARDGELLAENVPSYTLALVRERIDNLDETLTILKEILAIDEQAIADYRERLLRNRPFEEVPLLFDLTEEQIARLAVNSFRLQGVEVRAQLVRHYPYGPLFAHVLGYVGRINERDMARIDRDNYAGTYSIGKLGLERYYETQLHGTVGYQNVETDVRGKVLRVLERTDPLPGQDLQLHISVPAQQAAFAAMGDERGAVVAIDVRSGGVLAIVSTPSFDSNLFVHGISSKDYAAYRDSPDLPLFDRALQGQYPPASTVKPLLGLAGLHYGVVSEKTTVPDPGWYQLPNDDRRYRDWKKGGHAARIDVSDAITQSCDVYFYDLAYKMGIDQIHDFLSQFGFGQKTGVDLTSERSALLPSRAWKKRVHRLPWFPGETLNIGIGQGYFMATPIQLAAATVVTARRGEWVTPRVVQKLGEDELVPRRRKVEPVDQQDWDVVFNAMHEVVHGLRGTARAQSRGIKYQMAGKTGTAQVISVAQDVDYDDLELSKRQRDHALFVGFAPYDNPAIAVAVVVENGEHGSSAAAPVARRVMDAYLLDENGELKEEFRR